MKVLHGNRTFEATGEMAEVAVSSKLFTQWLARIDPRFVIQSINFQSVDLVKRGLLTDVLFIKLKADVRDADGKWVPGIVFLRGRSVAILPVIECEGKEYTVIVNQPRFAIGNHSFPELPAGMADGNTDERAVARKELLEETGLDPGSDGDFFNLTAAFYGKAAWVYPSPGACDEGMVAYACKLTLSHEELQALHGKRTGTAAENECIVLNVLPIEELPRAKPDATSHSVYLQYITLKKEGKLPW